MFTFDANDAEMAPSDVVFSFADASIRAIGIASSHAYEAPKPLEFGAAGAYWDLIDWRVDVAFVELRLTIRPSEHMQDLGSLLPKKYSPLLPMAVASDASRDRSDRVGRA